MGFGFNLFAVLILIPLAGILLVTWMLTRRKLFSNILGWMLILIFSLVLLTGIIRWLSAKTELDKEDYYGAYIIDRDFFPGKQADWQYNKFRFEIKENDSLYFHVTEKEKIIETYLGTISITQPYNSARLVLKMDLPTHHIIASNPTTFRSSWNFYLVFYSEKFNNVYFKKGQWKAIDK